MAHDSHPIPLIRTEKRGYVLEIVFDRADERNAFNTQMLLELSAAYTQLEDDSELRCALVYAEGKHFTLGLELHEVAATIRREQRLPIPEGNVDPWDLIGRIRRKPVVVAAHGFCFTLGIELLFAADIRIAAQGTRFAQAEVARGIMPFGGGTMRWVRDTGWGNAMRYVLTGEPFDAPEALRMGLIQEVVPKAALIDRGRALALLVSEQAPLAVQAARQSARRYAYEGFEAAAGDLLKTTLQLMDTEDAAEGVLSFQEKRKAVYKGR